MSAGISAMVGSVLMKPYSCQVYGDTGGLKIGFYYECEEFPCVPAMRRGVDMAVKALQERGHTVGIHPPPIGFIIIIPAIRHGVKSALESLQS